MLEDLSDQNYRACMAKWCIFILTSLHGVTSCFNPGSGMWTLAGNGQIVIKLSCFFHKNICLSLGEGWQKWSECLQSREKVNWHGTFEAAAVSGILLLFSWRKSSPEWRTVAQGCDFHYLPDLNVLRSHLMCCCHVSGCHLWGATIRCLWGQFILCRGRDACGPQKRKGVTLF